MSLRCILVFGCVVSLFSATTCEPVPTNFLTAPSNSVPPAATHGGIALCIFGQMRTFYSAGIYQHLRQVILEETRPDVFLNVASLRGKSSLEESVYQNELGIVTKRLNVTSAVAEDYPHQPFTDPCGITNNTGTKLKGCPFVSPRLPYLSDRSYCGVEHCESCDLSHVWNQYERRRRCFEQVKAYEQKGRGGKLYAWILLVRTDCVFLPTTVDRKTWKRFVSVEGKRLPRTPIAPPHLWSSLDIHPTAVYVPEILNDKAALIPRHLADTYFSVVNTFSKCIAKDVHEAECGEGSWFRPECVLKVHMKGLLKSWAFPLLVQALRTCPGGCFQIKMCRKKCALPLRSVKRRKHG
mmetsp:Transcript_37971/g.63850  ORF Transcript_37971/g.63850 Transcript_37971/m.63850 type:complete len:352 (-) Transcript_37971:860-1915(-)